MFEVVLYRPEIPPNTGNVIRLCANAGARLHLVEPLGFSMDDRQLRRAGLDYHELATVTVHPGWEHCLATLAGHRLFAVSARGTVPFAAPASASTAPPPDPWHHHHHHHHGHGPWGHGQGNSDGPPHSIVFKATLNGWNELPHGSGDRDGDGEAILQLSPSNQLCYALTVQGIGGRITGAHIHLGVASNEGPVVVTLARPSFGEVHYCQQIPSSLAAALGQTPSYYYINVHSTWFPDGAVRGQLERS